MYKNVNNNVDKYGSKHTGSQKNIRANIGGTYEQIRTDRVYIREHKYIRRRRNEDPTFKLPNICLVQTNFIISKTVLIRGTKTKLLQREELSTINREVLVSSQLH